MLVLVVLVMVNRISNIKQGSVQAPPVPRPQDEGRENHLILCFQHLLRFNIMHCETWECWYYEALDSLVDVNLIDKLSISNFVYLFFLCICCIHSFKQANKHYVMISWWTCPCSVSLQISGTQHFMIHCHISTCTLYYVFPFIFGCIFSTAFLSIHFISFYT